MIKTKKLNVNHKVGDIVECTQGLHKGLKFKVEVVIDSLNGYSCKKIEEAENKYYAFDDKFLVACK